MNDDAMVFAMANPEPEVMPEEAAEYARIVATGRSDYPNQINNVLCFPGLFRGALDARAVAITEEMKLAAAYGIAEVISPSELSEDYIIPSVFDRRVAEAVAQAVADEARRAGVSRSGSVLETTAPAGVPRRSAGTLPSWSLGRLRRCGRAAAPRTPVARRARGSPAIRSSDVSPLSSIEKRPTTLLKSVVPISSSTTRSRSAARSPARSSASSTSDMAVYP